MTIYTTISKRITFKPQQVAIPTKATVQQLLHEIKDCKSEAAFEHIFLLFRFAKRPANSEETEVLNLICEAYLDGCKLF